MQIGSLIHAAQAIVKTNSPAILTGIGVAGTATTAYLAAIAGAKASRAIAKEEIRHGHPVSGPAVLTPKEKAKIAWPLFMPAVGVGSLTVACIIGANHIGGRRAAALAGAYSLSEKAFSEYREKVVETVGTKKEEKVRDLVAQDKFTRDESGLKEIMLMESTESVCYESMTGRYFTTTVEKLKQARNDFNATLLHESNASLNDYWDLIGLPGTTVGEELGWTSDHLLEIHITTTLDKDKRPCLSLGYVTMPKAEFYRFR